MQINIKDFKWNSNINKLTLPIYFDNNATYPVKEEVIEEINKIMKICGNPSSANENSKFLKNQIEETRETIANFIGINSKNIIFTSGGSESNNTIIKSIINNNDLKEKNEILVTDVEHSSVMETTKFLHNYGYTIKMLNAGKEGFVDPNELKEKLNKKVAAVIMMLANNETGVISSLNECLNVIKKFNENIFIHSDMVQAFGKMDLKKIDFNNLDGASFSSHKFGGPLGIGFFYFNEKRKIIPLIHGGHQEDGKRAGTYNAPGIIGTKKAIELLDVPSYINITNNVKEYLEQELENNFNCKINCKNSNRVSNTTSVILYNIDTIKLIEKLSELGIYLSSGSACNTGNLSPVLKAIGCTKEEAGSTLRISLNEKNTKDEVDFFILKLKELVS